jgi:hypothetical protein
MKHTHLSNEIEQHEGNDWLGMCFAIAGGLIVATIIVDVATGMDTLHYWIASFF